MAFISRILSICIVIATTLTVMPVMAQEAEGEQGTGNREQGTGSH